MKVFSFFSSLELKSDVNIPKDNIIIPNPEDKANIPFIPKEVKIANNEPGAMFPIKLWKNAAQEPAVTPVVENPSQVPRHPKQLIYFQKY